MHFLEHSATNDVFILNLCYAYISFSLCNHECYYHINHDRICYHH